jgi:histidine triad (HIT) family protein
MKNPHCIFCKIVDGLIPSTKVYENEKIVAFNDLGPQASKHILFIHRSHNQDINEMMNQDPTQVQDIFMAIKEFTHREGLDQKGFRVVTNLGEHAGQTVFHTHFHVLGGEHLGHFGR